MGSVVEFMSASLALAQKRFLRQVRENILGYFWSLLTPAIYAVFFLMVKQSLSGDLSSATDYRESALRAFVGISLLQLWFQIIQDIAQIVRSNRGVLRAMSIEIYPFFMALVFDAVFSLLIRLAIIICAVFYFDFFSTIGWYDYLYIGAALLTMLTTAFFIGLLLAPWGALFNDVRKFLSSALMPVALLSPIFYPPVDTSGTFLFWVNHLNPFSSIVSVLTTSLFNHTIILGEVMFCWLAVSSILLIVLLRFLKKQVPILLERMGS